MRVRYLGFVLFPVAMLAYLGAVGYDLSLTASTTTLFVAATGGFALAAALAVRAGAWVAVAISLAVFVLVPHLGDLGLGPHFVSFAAVVHTLLFVAVGGVVLIALEHAVRNRKRVLESVSRRGLLASLAVGIGHLFAVTLVAEAAGDGVSGIATELFAAQPVEYAMLALVVAGLIALGTVPSLLFARWGLRLPAVVVAGGFALAILRTWRYVQETVHLGASPSPMLTYAVFWFVPLALALLVGGLEYRRLHGRSKLGATAN
ncbi:hypothetical protein C491_00747 [Natronococcus amylolyticus DSM 10524]|uniref:Uncharacterized protein n=1 Tax=Natronococcus amylolyticus DSM 10524 TaxID=1227497 RepID=L9XIU0_9EURY|nr:hypothetical protein [Natronococcus amylolyticus]ELY61341.1 hypothetical protein C491_00747 [Natronococcus amylolyticus DSM 10524]